MSIKDQYPEGTSEDRDVKPPFRPHLCSNVAAFTRKTKGQNASKSLRFLATREQGLGPSVPLIRIPTSGNPLKSVRNRFTVFCSKSSGSIGREPDGPKNRRGDGDSETSPPKRGLREMEKPSPLPSPPHPPPHGAQGDTICFCCPTQIIKLPRRTLA